MRLSRILLAALFALTLDAAASGDLHTWVTGTGVQITTVGPGAKLLVQCPDMTVQYRALNATEAHDAGQKNVSMNFILQPDPFPVRLRSYESRLALWNSDGGALGCGIYTDSP